MLLLLLAMLNTFCSIIVHRLLGFLFFLSPLAHVACRLFVEIKILQSHSDNENTRVMAREKKKAFSPLKKGRSMSIDIGTAFCALPSFFCAVGKLVCIAVQICLYLLVLFLLCVLDSNRPEMGGKNFFIAVP